MKKFHKVCIIIQSLGYTNIDNIYVYTNFLIEI